MCNSLVIALRSRFARTWAMADLDEAIRTQREVIDTVPVYDPNRFNYLENLGDVLGDRYLYVGALSDHHEAIQVTRQAVETIPDDHLERAGLLNKLGLLLDPDIYGSGPHTDADEAIRLSRKAVEMVPETYPERATYLYSLGRRLASRGACGDVQEAVVCFDFALRQPHLAVINRIRAGIALAEVCLDWHQAYESICLAPSLVPTLTPRSLQSSDKQRLLGQMAGLASDAAAIALQEQKGALVAIELLEQGRGVLGASLDEVRTDILDLQQAYPQLSEEFARLQGQLDQPATLGVARLGAEALDSHLATPALADQRYAAGKKFQDLIDTIHKLPGFEHFLGPPSESELRDAAGHGPIVVVNVSEWRCDALLVESHQMRFLELDSLSLSDIENRADKCDFGSNKTLEWLWDTVTSPVLEALGFTAPPSRISESWPRVSWVPTGLLSKFPLHAAGYHGRRSSETVLDRVMSSYSPSIKAILRGRSRPHSSPASASGSSLLVAMDRTPGFSPLGHAGSEISAVRTVCESMNRQPRDPGRRRKQDIMTQLPGCDIFHFAGHGYTDTVDPSRSYLCLADGATNPLRVADLLDLNLNRQSPFLAYLSACGTGQVHDTRYADESIHLIGACQLAGFRHVVGTLWEVDDEQCVDMARIVYEGIRDGGMTDESVCLGLHRASREHRSRWLDEISARESCGKRRRRVKSSAAGRRGLDRWARMPGRGRGGRLTRTDERAPRRTRRVFHEGSGMEKGVEDTRDPKADRNLGRPPRKIVLCDSDDEQDDGDLDPPFWIPYVHFGV